MDGGDKGQMEGEDGSGLATMSVLPVGCVSEILSVTSPLDVCTASAVSHVFKSAADSDAVWERFLPSDYGEILERVDSPQSVVFDSKRQLYFRLSDSHILLDGGKLSFMLDKRSGKKCYMIRARDLWIAWKDDTRYWRWYPTPESRFMEVVTLEQVWWLEIRCKLRTSMLSKKTMYGGYLVFKINEHNCNLSTRATTTVKCGAYEVEHSKVYLQEPSPVPVGRQQGLNRRLPRMRKDGWMEVELGEFFNDVDDDDEGDEDGEVEMIFREIRKYKRGLLVEGIEFRPKID